MKNYSELPDSMDAVELEKCFHEFLNEAVCLNKAEISLAFEQLYELSFRQFYTYELISDDISCQIEKFIMHYIDYESFEIMDCVMHIIPCLGLKNVFEKIISEKKVIKNSDVLKLIERCVIEFGNDAADPYFGFK